MAGVRVFSGRGFRGRRYRVLIEITYAGGRLAYDRCQMLTAEIKVPGARASRDLVVTMSPESVTIVTVSTTVDAASPRVALAMVDEALDRALMATGLFEEFDVTGKVMRVSPLQRADRTRQQSGGTGPAAD
jgi:hypothetical protein